jgi:hypothetical protein
MARTPKKIGLKSYLGPTCQTGFRGRLSDGPLGEDVSARSYGERARRAEAFCLSGRDSGIDKGW